MQLPVVPATYLHRVPRCACGLGVVLMACLVPPGNVQAQVHGLGAAPISSPPAMVFSPAGVSPVSPIQAVPPSRIILAPPPPPPPPPPLPAFVPQAAPIQPQGLNLPSPCLNCGFHPPDSAPTPEVSRDSDEQIHARQRVRIEELRQSAQRNVEGNKLEAALSDLDALLALLEEEGSAPQETRAQIRQVRDTVILTLGMHLLAEEKFADSLVLFQRAQPSAAREEGAAKALFGLGQTAEAFARLDAMEAYDRILSIRLRGYFYEELGALPLAVEQFEGAAGVSDIAQHLSLLDQRGLRHFEKSGDSNWTIYRSSGNTQPTRVLSYWFGTAASGTIEYSRSGVLAVRPAPRELTLGLVLRNLIRLRWPESATAQEYSLTVHGLRQSDLVAMWDHEPTREQITSALVRGLKAMQQLKLAEEYLHGNRAQDALFIALTEGKTEGWFFPEQPNYAALVKAVQAAVEMKDDRRAREIAEEISSWHPMWGPLVLANALQQADQAAAARTAYEEAIVAAPLRGEAYQKSAEFEWDAAKAQKDQDRAEAFLRAQRAARRLETLNPAAGLWLRAQIAAELQANSQTWILLQKLSGLADVPEAAMEQRALLEALGQSKFVAVGEALSTANGLQLRSYRTREPAPEDPALVHHGLEVLVLTSEGDLVETFSLSSQGVPPGSPRQFMLDRINAFGLQSLRMYGARPPSIDRVIKGVAAL